MTTIIWPQSIIAKIMEKTYLVLTLVLGFTLPYQASFGSSDTLAVVNILSEVLLFIEIQLKLHSAKIPSHGEPISNLNAIARDYLW